MVIARKQKREAMLIITSGVVGSIMSIFYNKLFSDFSNIKMWIRTTIVGAVFLLLILFFLIVYDRIFPSPD